jgi:hypothetical protein
MNAIENLCSKVVILQKGNLVKYGDTHKLVSDYINENKDFNQTNLWLTENVKLLELSFEPNELFSGDELNFALNLEYTGNEPPVVTDLCLLLYSLKGIRVAIIDLRPYLDKIKVQDNKLQLKGMLNNLNLVEGEYAAGLYYGFNGIRKEVLDITLIRVKPSQISDLKVNPYLPQYRGFLELISNVKIN